MTTLCLVLETSLREGEEDRGIIKSLDSREREGKRARVGYSLLLLCALRCLWFLRLTTSVFLFLVLVLVLVLVLLLQLSVCNLIYFVLVRSVVFAEQLHPDVQIHTAVVRAGQPHWTIPAARQFLLFVPFGAAVYTDHLVAHTRHHRRASYRRVGLDCHQGCLRRLCNWLISLSSLALALRQELSICRSVVKLSLSRLIRRRRRRRRRRQMSLTSLSLTHSLNQSINLSCFIFIDFILFVPFSAKTSKRLASQQPQVARAAKRKVAWRALAQGPGRRHYPHGEWPIYCRRPPPTHHFWTQRFVLHWNSWTGWRDQFEMSPVPAGNGWNGSGWSQNWPFWRRDYLRAAQQPPQQIWGSAYVEI